MPTTTPTDAPCSQAAGVQKAKLTIRTATLNDLPGLHRVAERAVWELLAAHYSEQQGEAARSVKVYSVETELVEDGTYYVLELDGVLVGGSGWSDRGGFHPQFPPNADGSVPGLSSPSDAAVMRSTYVDPDWAGRGLATLLARATETAAVLAGFQRFEALCTPASEGLRRKLGYRVVERTDLPLTGGISLSMAHMRKELVPTAA